MRSILLHIFDDECLEARLQAALDIARQCDGHITCVQAVPYPIAAPVDFYGTMVSQMAVEYDKIATDVQTRIQKRLGKEDVPWNWVRSSGPAIDVIARYAPLNEIVIVGSRNPSGKSEVASQLVGALTDGLQAPVLVIPEKLHAFDLQTPVILAWNGSSEAANALRFAMPLLSRASQVHIVMAREEKENERFDIPSTEAAEYLARHGVEAEIIELSVPSESSIAAVIKDAAKERKAGYLVMGAYGHSRFRERILGGVTRDMLSDPQIPLLLAG